MATMSSQIKRLYEFGPYRLDPQKRLLHREDEGIPLTPKAVETLLVLVENRGRVVSKDELMKTLWPDSFVEESNLSQNIFLLRRALGDSAQERRYILTIPGRGYQFTETVREIGVQDEPEALLVESHSRTHVVVEQPVLWSRRLWAGLGLAVLTLLLLAGLYVRAVRTDRLQPNDTIVVGDFVNSSGDPIFDDTLKQGLILSLRQSPFLNILPQSKVSSTLRLMTRDPDSPLTPALASEVCQRAGTKAYVTGAIGSLGSEYVLGLKAVNCHSGDTLAQEQVTAPRKEQVLAALSEAATKLRRELGESLTTVRKFGVPLTEATTASLEALRQYSQGLHTWNTKGERDAIPYLKRAIELDPNFASAYVSLGTVYANLELPDEAAENMTKAYQLRDHVSERERFYIQAHYYSEVTEELEKEIPIYQQWIEEYPNEPTPHTNLGNIYEYLGRPENALTEHLQALRVEANGVLIYENLALNYFYLNRFDDAIATVNQAFARQLDDVTLHLFLMQLSFLRGDATTVQREFDWGQGKSGIEDAFLATQSDIEAAGGHLTKARDLTRRAVLSALHSGSKETAAFWQGQGALHEAEVGNSQEAAKQAEAALTLSRNNDIRILAGLALSRAGRIERAKAIADQLDHDLPRGTLLQFYWLPAMRAMMQLNSHDSTAALQTLQPAIPYEMCVSPPWQGMGASYLRGQALLQSHQGAAAATEFQRVLAHRVMVNFWSASLANLELGRSYAVSGNIADAKKAYGDFLTLWKDADSDIPVLKSAKVEYAKLN